nr:MAG: hypothetical protein DIU55_10475 [Bacillota bacterium]
MDKTEELLKASFNRLEELIGEVRELRYKIKSVQGDVESLRAELRASWRKGEHGGGGSGAPGRAGSDGGEGGKAEGGPAGSGGRNEGGGAEPVAAATAGGGPAGGGAGEAGSPSGVVGAACAVGSAPGSGSGQGRPGAAGHVQEGSAAASGWGQGSPGDGGHGPDGTAGTPAEANARHASTGPVGGSPGDIAALALGYGSVAMGAELAAVGGGKAVPGRAAGAPGQAGPEGAAGRGRLEEGSLERRLRRIEERLDYLSNKWMELDEKVFHLQKRLHTSAPGT